jgi:hypothetical protein
LVLASLVALTGTAAADPWKDESGQHRWRGVYDYSYRGNQRGPYAQEFREEFRQGDCKVERRLERSGEYREEIRCRPNRR